MGAPLLLTGAAAWTVWVVVHYYVFELIPPEIADGLLGSSFPYWREAAQRTLGLRLLVVDDGRGIASDRAAGFGMASMQERADRIGASLTIVTAPRAGTQVVLAWEPPAAGQ